MNEFLNNNISDKLKKILKDNIEPHCSIIEYANIRLYVSYDDHENFEYTNLEGCLCLVVNRKYSCLFLQLYEYINYKKEFEIELYTNIEKGYSVLHDNFHCIEYPSFFIGLSFSNKINAEKMKNTILYNSIILNFQSSLFHLPNSKKEETNNQRNINLLNEMNNMSTIEEIEKPEKIVCFSINREENIVTYEVKREDFDSNFASLGLYITNLDQHYDKKIKGSIVRNKEVLNNTGYTNTIENKKFVEFDSSKRKSIYGGFMRNTTNVSGFGEDDRRTSLKNLMQFQVIKI